MVVFCHVTSLVLFPLSKNIYFPKISTLVMNTEDLPIIGWTNKILWSPFSKGFHLLTLLHWLVDRRLEKCSSYDLTRLYLNPGDHSPVLPNIVMYYKQIKHFVVLAKVIISKTISFGETLTRWFCVIFLIKCKH